MVNSNSSPNNGLLPSLKLIQYCAYFDDLFLHEEIEPMLHFLNSHLVG